MLGAISTALSGMNAFSQGLQTISDNVANLDTLGYKSQVVSFEDVFNQGGNGLDYTAGAADDSIGAGVVEHSNMLNFTQGTMQQTGGNLDLAVQGNGFLVLKNADGDTFYTTTSQFAVDSGGFISSSSTGDRLTILNSSNQAVPINVNAFQTNAPVATSTIDFADNLSSAATSASVPNMTVFDGSGAAHTWTVNLVPTATANQWTVSVTDETGATIGTGTIQFTNGVIDPTQSTVTISATYAGAAPLSVTLNFASVTSFAQGSTNTLQTSKVDGSAAGTLTGITLNSSGELVASYSNNNTVVLGSVAIADFQNPQQLLQISNGLFQSKVGAAVTLQSSGQGGVGSLTSGEVEQSNVNLTEEFGDLILIQRGFDACSQVVSASNDMIQDLFGLRGHG
ncbi:MAG TPA: flagellar hook-basal body complex protein [Caulobacteraceae bacterium]|jgi:flagellar hook protein FlgE|nr:flagellar hook-basal body complex protein [Caulobacteraceae bacterium]